MVDYPSCPHVQRRVIVVGLCVGRSVGHCVCVSVCSSACYLSNRGCGIYIYNKGS